jgi:hypothetical protein
MCGSHEIRSEIGLLVWILMQPCPMAAVHRHVHQERLVLATDFAVRAPFFPLPITLAVSKSPL